MVCCYVLITSDISFLVYDAATDSIIVIVICIGNASIFRVILKLVKGVCFILSVKKSALPPLVINDFNQFPTEVQAAEITDKLVTKSFHRYAGLICMLHHFKLQPIILFIVLKFDRIPVTPPPLQ